MLEVDLHFVACLVPLARRAEKAAKRQSVVAGPLLEEGVDLDTHGTFRLLEVRPVASIDELL
jgi:hypothetical protein